MGEGLLERCSKSLLCLAASVVVLLLLAHPLVAQSALSAGNSEKCSMNLECPPPVAKRGQDLRCLESVCVRGACVIKARVGHAVDGVITGGSFSCFAAPLRCDGSGKAMPVTDTSRLIPIREGQHCIPSITSSNPCQKPVCRDKVCVHEPNDEAACPEGAISVTACEKRGCRNGACQAVPDPKKLGTQCRDSETAACRTTTYVCAHSGACEPRTRLAESAQCADNPLTLGASSALPPAFKELALSSASFPSYSCNVTACTVEFCGDGVINRGEECDGSAMPSNAPAGRRCNSSCRVEGN